MKQVNMIKEDECAWKKDEYIINVNEEDDYDEIYIENEKKD